MDNEQYWSIYLDDFIEKMYDLDSETKGSHCIGFKGDRETVRQKIADAFMELIDREMYQSTNYGYPIPPVYSKWLAEEIERLT